MAVAIRVAMLGFATAIAVTSAWAGAQSGPSDGGAMDVPPRVTQQVHFGFGKSHLFRESTPVLDAVVEQLSRAPNVGVQIEGYAADDERAGMVLSRWRAISIAHYIMEHGQISP